MKELDNIKTLAQAEIDALEDFGKLSAQLRSAKLNGQECADLDKAVSNAAVIHLQAQKAVCEELGRLIAGLRLNTHYCIAKIAEASGVKL